jgi:hypothetical protein
VHFFGYVIPVGAPEVTNNRGGTPWWDVLVANGVDVPSTPTPPRTRCRWS